MRVLIADDEISVRSALRRLLKEQPGVGEILEAANLGELIAIAKTEALDLILLDWDLSGMPSSGRPELTGLAKRSARGDKLRNVLLAELRKFSSHPRVIVMSSRPEARQGCLFAGADGFVFKGDPPERLLQAICLSFPNDSE